MVRKYDSRRRQASAARTRQAIVEAAVRLHAIGITTVSAVADEAGVSLPTVNKYFPTREDLFGACTRYVAERLEIVPPEELAAIADPAERLAAVVRQLFAVFEQSLGHAWTGYVLEDESPTMAQAMAQTDGLARTIADVLFEGEAPPDALRSFVHGLLHPLTYRALRVKQGLSHDEAAEYMVAALGKLLDIAPPCNEEGS
jgi:AcrR family transcriptional regulator